MSLVKRNNVAPVAAVEAADKPAPAMFWLNIGYHVEDPATGEQKFVSLPLGIPLDQCTPVKTNSSNADWAAFQAARNDLLEQLIEAGSELKSGEAIGINLEVQLRRVNEEAAPTAAKHDNPYVRRVL